MQVVFAFPNEISGRVFFTWTPVEVSIHLEDSDGTDTSVEIRSAAGTVPLVFDSVRSDTGTDTLQLTLPGDESAISFWAAGKFQIDPATGEPLVNQGSTTYGDAELEVIDLASGNRLAFQKAMVRVRKDANTLTPAERDRFLVTFGILNGAGTGRFTNFRDMHSTRRTDRESHGNMGFLPWHRAYLLDLERELQAINDEVTLPYWRFDRAAPNLFRRNYMGFDGAGSFLEFTSGHPFETWETDGLVGIERNLLFPPNQAPPGVRTQDQTVGLGKIGGNSFYAAFARMEGNPHGRAHTRYDGYIDDTATAPRDPLFFLLHCNVDRLWARWQWLDDQMDSTNSTAFSNPRPFPDPTGHRFNDTMWPWNGVTGSPRPPDAPGGTLAPSPLTSAPGLSPRVGDMIDYQGSAGGEQHHFCYDTVPFDIQ